MSTNGLQPVDRVDIMAYCPSCNAEILESASRCEQCDAVFGGDSAWRPTPTPIADRPSKGGRILWRFLLAVYALVLVACIVTFAMNPPWERGRYAGVLALAASLVAGLPWSVLALFAMAASQDARTAGPSLAAIHAVGWTGAVANVWLLGALNGFWRFRFWKRDAT